jgi:hypothetical protein
VAPPPVGCCPVRAAEFNFGDHDRRNIGKVVLTP